MSDRDYVLALEAVKAMLAEVMGSASADLLVQQSRERALEAAPLTENDAVRPDPPAEAHLGSLLQAVRALTGEVLDQELEKVFERAGIKRRHGADGRA